MKRQLLYSFVLILSLTQAAQAGSVLSSYGIGLFYRFPTTRAMGMGGANIAFSDPLDLSRLNPAGNAQLAMTTVSIQFFYEGNQFKDTEGSAYSDYGNFDGFQFAIPLGNRMSFSMGLQPWTRMNFDVTFDQSMEGIEYSKRIEGSGGINTLDFSYSWAPNSKLSIGITGHYLFGRTKEIWWVEYENTSYVKTRDVYSSKVSGMHFTAGVLYQPLSRLSLAVTYTPRKTFVNESKFSSVFITDSELPEGNLTMPSMLGFGVQVTPSKNVRCLADYEIQNWTEFDLSTRQNANFTKVQRFAIGAEYIPSIKPAASYFQRTVYRAGFTTQPFFGKDNQNNNINETWVTLGLGLPMYMGMSQLDIALGFGQRGNLSTNGIKENLFRVSISLTGTERWFLRRY